MAPRGFLLRCWRSVAWFQQSYWNDFLRLFNTWFCWWMQRWGWSWWFYFAIKEKLHWLCFSFTKGETNNSSKKRQRKYWYPTLHFPNSRTSGMPTFFMRQGERKQEPFLAHGIYQYSICCSSPRWNRQKSGDNLSPTLRPRQLSKRKRMGNIN